MMLRLLAVADSAAAISARIQAKPTRSKLKTDGFPNASVMVGC